MMSSPEETTPQAKEAAKPEATAKAMGVQVSPAAVEAIKTQVQKRNVPGTSLRAGVRGGGCSGFSYVIEFYDGEPHTRDVVMDFLSEDGTPVRLLIDKKSLVFLNGSTLHYERTLQHQGFKFLNPQEKASCGCGHSFTV